MTMQGTRWTRSGVLALLLMLSGCGGIRDGDRPGDRQSREAVFDAASTALVASPCDRTTSPYSAAVSTATSGTSDLEHEVHDCQRLILEDQSGQLSYGPLVALIPIDSAMKLPRSGFRDGVAVASIFNWGDFEDRPLDYSPLGIPHHWSCLWLRNRGGSATGWEAAIVPAGGVACTDQSTKPDDPAYAAMDAEERTLPGAQPADYPPTARWGWDPGAKRHYMGMRCGVAWCLAGADGFAPTEPQPLTGAHHTRAVPGWFDTQILAVPVPRGPGQPDSIRPGPVGFIYPHRRLGQMSESDWRNGLEAAEIEIHRTSGQADFDRYVQKFNLQVTGAGDVARGRIHLTLSGPNLTIGDALYRPGASGTAGQQTAPGVEVTPHVTHAAPGAVRWRWLDTDEGPWVSCRPGCCYIRDF